MMAGPFDPSTWDLLSAFDNAPIGMAVLTPLGVITTCNAAMGRLLQRPPHELVGGTFFDVTHPDDLDAAAAQCNLINAGDTRILRHECRFLRADGAVVWVLVSTSRVPAHGDRSAHLIMHIEDITDRKNLEEELSYRALHDPLTGLANRTLLTQRLHTALTRRGRHARPTHLFYIDLDGFKSVNDRFGHAAGDEVLRQLAGRISALLRPDDIAARLGGDEFAVLCEVSEPQHADSIAERLRAAAAEPFVVNGLTVRLSAAIGSSTARVSGLRGVEPADMLREADESMYATKRRRQAVTQ